MRCEIVGVLLAAGEGRRFGGDKLRHGLPGGLTVAQSSARALRAACERVIAVLRPGSEGLARELAAEGVETLICDDAHFGMGHSLAAGVRATPHAAGWLVALADMPFIRPATCRAVADQLRAGAALAAPSLHGKRGHPVGFDARWGAALADLHGDEGARTLLAGHPVTLVAVDDPGILRDIDRREDLA